MGFFTDPNRHVWTRAYALEFFDVTGDPVDDALRWWLTWNEWAMSYADAVFALEGWSPELLASLLELLEVDDSEKRAQTAFASVPTSVNSSRRRGDEPSSLKWTDIPESETKTLAGKAAERWGYDVLDESYLPVQR
jgi:hypothetical protein